MAKSSNLRSINCTQCGAPLELLGGHNVQSITCSYCGSVLDSREEYKVVAQFKNRQRPITPFKLGMSGKIKGVEFIIIGLIQYRSDDGYGWLEFGLFSPTHGYAWLAYEGGHYTFSRRVRDLPNRPIPQQHKSTVRARGQDFQVYDFFSATVKYVEGELTWVAKAGDQVSVIEAVDPPYFYSREKTAGELEYQFGEYLDAEAVHAAFKIDELPARRTNIHGAQPYTPNAVLSGLSGAAKWFAPLALIMLLYTFIVGGDVLLTTNFSPALFKKEQTSAEFEVKDPNSLMGLYLDWPINNAWGYYDVTINQDDEPIFSMAKQISYYSGYSGGESWSEGAKDATAFFKVPQAGVYSVSIEGEGGTGETGTVPPNVSLNVVIREGIVASRYYFILFVFAILAVAGHLIHKLGFEGRRWSEVIEDDDDDDDD